MSTEVLGVAGVALLLAAFGLNLLKKLGEAQPVYLLMNLLGAGLAVIYALQTESIPFVVLEAFWSGFALIRLVQVMGGGSAKLTQ